MLGDLRQKTRRFRAKCGVEVRRSAGATNRLRVSPQHFDTQFFWVPTQIPSAKTVCVWGEIRTFFFFFMCFGWCCRFRNVCATSIFELNLKRVAVEMESGSIYVAEDFVFTWWNSCFVAIFFGKLLYYLRKKKYVKQLYCKQQYFTLILKKLKFRNYNNLNTNIKIIFQTFKYYVGWLDSFITTASHFI